MGEKLMLGAQIRALRRREELTQAGLAARLGVSASYLNLIENNRRPLSAKLLIKLATEFKLDLGTFAPSGDARLISDLREVFGDSLFEGSPLTNKDLGELARAAPNVAEAVLQLYRAYCATRDSADAFAEQLSGDVERLEVGGANPTEAVNQMLQRRGNHFPAIEDAAEAVWKEAKLRADDIWAGLVEYLRARFGVEVVIEPSREGQPMRAYDPKRKTITISEVLPPRSRRFQLAHQVGLLRFGDLFDGLESVDALGSESAHALTRVVFANYFAAAVFMPYTTFLEAAEEVRYDIVLLAHRFRTSFEQVCHRLTTLGRPGEEGIPFHFLRIDIAGNISKRFSGSGIRMPRFSGACPRWNIHSAFLTPGRISVQLSRMVGGGVYFCIARTIERASGGYNMPHTVHSIGLGCEVRFAKKMVYSDGVDLSNLDSATPVGVTCRTCEQESCEQRVASPMQRPLSIDENVRGLSFYSPTKR